MHSYRLLCCILIILLSNTFSKGQKKQKSLAAASPFPVGVAINTKLISTDQVYRETVLREFNSITAENSMKPHHLYPSINGYFWEVADSLVKFCQKNNKRLHGHTLVWHEAIPAWAKGFTDDSATLERQLKEYIQTVASHFKGKVASWDVVNEAISDTAGAMRKTLWQKHLGNDYVARCFQYAKAADPSAKLFYNDYNLESDSIKLMAALRMVDDFKRRNIPIDGVGLQMHITKDTPIKGIERAMQEFARRGLLVHVSELDVRVNTTKDSVLTLTNQLLEEQREKVKQIVNAYMQLPATYRFGITTWGLADPNSWIMKFFKKEDYPLLLDKSYKPKPAYFGFLEGLR